jgi:hypothetical protein
MSFLIANSKACDFMFSKFIVYALLLLKFCLCVCVCVCVFARVCVCPYKIDFCFMHVICLMPCGMVTFEDMFIVKAMKFIIMNIKNYMKISSFFCWHLMCYNYL